MKTQSSSRILKSWWRRSQSSAEALSLRSLAKKLEVSPGYLSKIFSGQSNIPQELIKPLVKALKFDPATEAQFFESLRREAIEKKLGFIKTKIQDTEKQSPLDSYELADADAEWLLASWHRTALLDLTTLKIFKSDINWISKKLGVSTTEVEQSILYLKQSGLLIEDSEGRLRKAHLHLRFPSTTSKKIFRQHHISQMKRASEYLEKAVAPTDFADRLVFGITVACDKSKLEEVKLALHKALYEAAQNLSTGNCEEIYQLNLQVFPHTKAESA